VSRYIIQASFSDHIKLSQIQSRLSHLGISKKKVNYVAFPAKKDEGFTISLSDKGPTLGAKFLPFGLVIGLILYIAYIFSGQDRTFFENLSDINISGLLIGTMVGGLVFFYVGFLFGKKSPLHIVNYNSKEANKKILVAVSANEEQLEESKNILTQLGPQSLDVLDKKHEVEVGLREN
jgi:hypothetical protein